MIGREKSAEPYLRALTGLGGVRVIGLLDRSRKSGDAHPSVPSTDDPATAVEWSGVDAFIHCGPLADDPESVTVVGSSGKPMLVDARSGRHRADAQTIRTCIESGDVGRLVFARFAAGGTAGNDQLMWQEREHVLDMLGWWVDDKPETVYAQRIDDYESVTVRYAGGATAVCDIDSSGPPYREITVVGTSASISVPWSDHTNVMLPGNGARAKYADGSPSLEAVLEEWLERVRTGAAPIIDTSELAAAIALEEAVELSVASGRVAPASPSLDTGGEA